MAERAFEIIDNEDEPASRPKQEAAGTAMLLLGLKTLSQRALSAVADLFTLVTVGSAFWLWMHFPEPSVNQLIAEAMYGAFVLAINFVVRK